MTDDLDVHAPAYGEGFGYAFDNNIISNWYPERIMALCPPEGHLLELGIGRGVTTDAFSRYFARHIVVDGSQVVIGCFRKQFPRCSAEVVQSYFEDYQPTQQFDVIVMGFVLEHVRDPVVLLARVRDWVKPGTGRLFIAVPNGESLHRRFGHAAGILPDMMAMGKGDLQLGHHRVYSVAALTADLSAAGWLPLRQEGIFLKALTTEQLISLKLGPNLIRGMCKVGINYPELCCALLFEAIVSESES
jgi:SAM-dependent methyltransferase